eukprot:1240714-Rhodomonas_salina.2
MLLRARSAVSGAERGYGGTRSGGCGTVSAGQKGGCQLPETHSHTHTHTHTHAYTYTKADVDRNLPTGIAYGGTTLRALCRVRYGPSIGCA